MDTLLRFNFVDTDGMGADVDIFVLTHIITNNMKNQIEDAITSYIEAIEDWEYEELINEVFASLDLDYKIIRPITYKI